jgi:hypothetical protein
MSTGNTENYETTYDYNPINLVTNELTIRDLVRGRGLNLEIWYKNNPSDVFVNSIMEKNIDRYKYDISNEIYLCYKYIVENNRFDVIDYIIVNSEEKSFELLCICINAIDQNRIDILILLQNRKYDFNKQFNPNCCDYSPRQKKLGQKKQYMSNIFL